MNLITAAYKGSNAIKVTESMKRALDFFIKQVLNIHSIRNQISSLTEDRLIKSSEIEIMNQETSENSKDSSKKIKSFEKDIERIDHMVEEYNKKIEKLGLKINKVQLKNVHIKFISDLHFVSKDAKEVEETINMIDDITNDNIAEEQQLAPLTEPVTPPAQEHQEKFDIDQVSIESSTKPVPVFPNKEESIIEQTVAPEILDQMWQNIIMIADKKQNQAPSDLEKLNNYNDNEVKGSLTEPKFLNNNNLDNVLIENKNLKQMIDNLTTQNNSFKETIANQNQKIAHLEEKFTKLSSLFKEI